jgi:hypothetical protein
LAPLNPGCINSNHTHGTHVPVEEPSTASKADMGPFHSITSSARESSEGGTVRPSAFAVFKLMTNSIFVGRSTGR